MNARTVTLLAIGVVVLFAAMFALNAVDRDDPLSRSGDLLLPGLKTALDDLETVTITTADETVTIREADGRWIVPEKGGYPADTARLRALLLALSEARTIEEKTSNPEMYEHLGVDEPGDGGGVLVSVASSGDGGAQASVILGDPAQGEYRYARLPDEAQSWLIDRNPEVPAEVGGWLSQDIVDIAATRVRAAEIRHADGETIRLSKDSPDENSFQVEDIPAERELSYPSVADNIAGILGGLQLEDVRTAGVDDRQPSATASFATFDGLTVDVAIYREDNGEETDETGAWITLDASALPTAAEAEATAGDAVAGAESGAPADAAGEETEAPETGTGGGATAVGDDAGATETETAEPAPTPEEEAAAINERVSGWQFRIADYKAQQLTRRWEDLLSDQDQE